MPVLDPARTLGDLVSERPARSRVFERFGLDYCCGGKEALRVACERRRVDLAAVLDDLQTADFVPPPQRHWATARLSELIAHIVTHHHGFLRAALPRLSGLIEKVARVHGERHPEMQDVEVVFRGLRDELESHLLKEERVLFPAIEQMEAAEGPIAAAFGTIRNPIGMMEDEHEAAGAALERMRTLTGGYACPADGCNTFRVLLAGLRELELDLHEHIHKENNILFPRAAQLERAVPSACACDHEEHADA